VGARVRPVHRRIVKALEKAVPRHAALDDLAYHSLVAGDAARSRRYNELAGDHAAAMHDEPDARSYYARARTFTGIGSRAHSRLTRKLAAIDETSRSARS